MKKSISFTIYDKPIPLKRHRHSAHCTYNPQKQEQETFRILMQTYLNQASSFSGSPLTGPLEVKCHFYFKLPKTKRLREKKGLYHTGPKDLDNLCKFVFDCCNGIIYEDDRQICKLIAGKYYTADRERTEVTITEIEQADIITPLIREKKYENKKDTSVKEKFYGATRPVSVKG